MMVTCPHCGLVGNIGEEKLKTSSGSIRCPRCQKIFAPIDKKPPTPSAGSPGARGAAPAKKGGKKDPPVLFGARSGDDIPFTKIMEESGSILEEDLTIEIEGMDGIDIPEEVGADEILSLGEEDIVSIPEEPSGGGQAQKVGPAADIPVEGSVPLTPVDVPESPPPTVLDAEPAGGAKEPRGGPPGIMPGPIAADKAGRPVSGKPAPRKVGLRKGFILFFIVVLALWGSYWFFSTYWPPYAQEKEFLDDSRALFDKYHELRVYLKVGMPDPVFATKVAEAAYVWEVYREKHESKYKKDPLFASLMIMGRLFLTIKELLDRDMYPDNYLELEWGEGFPFPTKEDYVSAMVTGIPICISAAEENFVFCKKILEHAGGLTFISMTVSNFTKVPIGPSRAEYAADLKRANKTFVSLDTEMPVLTKAVADVRNTIDNLPGK